ncbi:response regulator [Mycolicibacterium obuense]|uniref:response regulator n=1 Tax=Mycolicibacterium obuense TaxID=1807 RepID=UPI00069BD3B9|nr:response regulator [Mycolicibacterium obuense]
MRRSRAVAAGSAVAIAALDLIGWATGFWLLTQFDVDWPRMTPWSAILLIALSIALLLQTARSDKNPDNSRALIGRALALVVAVFETVFLVEHATHVSVGVDQWWFPEAVNALATGSPGRPLVQTAISMLVLSLVIACVDLEHRWASAVWPAILVAAAAFPLVAILTFLFEEAEMLDASPPIGMNGATAAAVLLLVYSAGASRPDRHPLAWVLGREHRRKLTQLVVAFALVPVMVAVCRLIVIRLGLSGESVWGVAIGLTTFVLGAYSFREFRRIQQLTTDQLRQTQERVAAERQRAEAVQQFRILADNTVDVVVHLHGDTPIWVSPSIEQAFGWPIDAWVGHDFSPRIHPEDLTVVFEALAEIAQGMPALARFRVATADHDYRWVEGRGQPYLDAGGVADGVIVAVRVIDAQVEIEQQLQQARDTAVALAEAKSDYVATVSHEIRSPLHAILGFAELLERQLSTAGRSDAAEWSRRVRAEAERLTRLIEDLLELARLDAGRTTLSSRPFQLRKVVDDVVELSRIKAQAKGLTLRYSVDPTLADWRLGDADRLHQVLRNLVTNAKKFTEEGGVELEVSSAGIQGTGELIRFAVSDTGPGIPGTDIARIFEAFGQVRAADAARGSGLGLTISNRLVKAMGGDGIAVVSLEGHGSTFQFTIPLPEHAPAESAAVPAVRSDRVGDRKAVLVVDDNATNQLLIEAQLSKLGHHCELASDGAQALERIEAGHFDVVLMDCSMPVMDGYEATRRIRARERQTGEHLPVLALTASASGSNRAACERAGMDGFLTKPIHLSDLAREIGRFIELNSVQTSAAKLDCSRFDRLRAELGSAALEKVISTYIAEMPRRLTELHRMADDGDADAMRRCAHAVRSPSAMLGATALAGALRAVEDAVDPISLLPQSQLDYVANETIALIRAELGRTTSSTDPGGS